MTEVPTACLRCGRPLPERLEPRGRPRRFCSAACRKAYSRANAPAPAPVETGLPDTFEPSTLPPLPDAETVTRRRHETAEAVVAFLAGAEPAGLEERLTRTLIETRACSVMLRRLGRELRPGLAYRATGLADAIDEGTARWFEGLLDG